MVGGTRPVTLSADAESAGRAARRLRRHRRDRGAPRPGARGAVPGPGVRRDPASARRVGKTTSSSPSTGCAAGPPSSSTRSSSRELREAMRTLCRRARLHYCDLLGHPIDAVARVSGQAATHDARLAAAAQLRVLQADGGDRVRGPLRRRRRARPPRCGRRARRRLPHLEDPALDLPRLPRPQGRERPGREGDRAAGRALRGRPGEGRRPHDRPEPARRDPPRERSGRWARPAATGSTPSSPRSTTSSSRPRSSTAGSAAP